MKIPKIFNGCNSVKSMFFQIWKLVGAGLHHENACKCCVFWRGAAFATILVSPALLIDSAITRAIAVLGIAAFLVIVAAINSYLEEDDYE